MTATGMEYIDGTVRPWWRIGIDHHTDGDLYWAESSFRRIGQRPVRFESLSLGDLLDQLEEAGEWWALAVYEPDGAS